MEILPTLAAAGHAFPPDVYLDGFNMLPVLQGTAPSPRKEMFWEWPSSYQAARVGHYNWVSYVPRRNPENLPPKEELFDLMVDLGEQNNIAAERPEVLEHVRARFARWQAEMEAAEPRRPFRNF